MQLHLDRTKLYIFATLSGIILAELFSKYLWVGSGLALAPWAIVGLILGWLSLNRRDALVSGSLYGFVLSFVFMLAGYTGQDPAITKLPFFILLGVFGALCGLTLAVITQTIHTKIAPHDKAPA